MKASLKRSRYAIRRVEAGEADAPVVLFDSSRADRYRVVAPIFQNSGPPRSPKRGIANTPSNGGDEFHSEEGKIIPSSE